MSRTRPPGVRTDAKLAGMPRAVGTRGSACQLVSGAVAWPESGNEVARLEPHSGDGGLEVLHGDGLGFLEAGRALAQIDADVFEPVQPGQGVGDGLDAVLAAHAFDLDGLDAHGNLGGWNVQRRPPREGVDAASIRRTAGISKGKCVPIPSCRGRIVKEFTVYALEVTIKSKRTYSFVKQVNMRHRFQNLQPQRDVAGAKLFFLYIDRIQCFNNRGIKIYATGISF